MPEDPTPITPRTFPAVVPRNDSRLSDETQLLVRFSTDKEAEHALSNALGNAQLYRSVPGYETYGAVTISVYVVFDAAEARTMAAARGVFGLCSIGRVRSHGSEVVATSVFDETGVPAPFNDRHADVIVMPYPADRPAYELMSRAERRALRAELLGPYTAAVRLFDPRWDTSGTVVWPTDSGTGPANPRPGG